MDPDKVRAMLDYSLLSFTSKQERTRTIFGLGRLVNNFIPNFADLSAPLNDLRVKHKIWDWSEK